MWVYKKKKKSINSNGVQGKNLSKGGLLSYIRYTIKNVLIMFMYACKSMVLIRIKASFRGTKPMEENHMKGK